MNFFEKEMRQMFDDEDMFQDAKFVGKTMLAKLDDDLRIKLQFVSSHISGQYDTVQMTIINRTEGVVDKQNFKFSDIIGQYLRSGREPLDYHMWEYMFCFIIKTVVSVLETTRRLPVKNINLMFFTAMGIASSATPIFFLRKRNKKPKDERTVRTNGDLPLGSKGGQQRYGTVCGCRFRLSELYQYFERL